MIVIILCIAGIAQLVEQWIENPRVSSSNLDPGNLINKILHYQILKFFIKD